VPRSLRLEPLEELCLPSFFSPVSYPVGSLPQAVVAADFNNDARPDLAVTNYLDNTVSVLLGNPDGTFQPARNSATGNNPSSLAVGDFDADGKNDLVAVNAYSGASVLLGRGDGTFQAPASIGAGYDWQSVAVGDFNADGKLDLGAVSNWYNYGYYSSANVLLGTGTGTFSGPSWSDLGYGYHTAAAVADFNGDLKLDLAARNYDTGTVEMLFGNGTGSFGPYTSVAAGSYFSRSLVASDVNKDGKVDLVATDPVADSVSVMLGNGLGSFAGAQSYVAGSHPQALATADFNGDGSIDLITTNYETGTASVLLGAGGGAFRPPVNAAAGSYPYGVAVGDFNGDGRPDAATTNPSSSNASVLLNDGTWPALSAPSLAVNDVTVTEGNTGTVSATFTVSLSAAAGQTVTVYYATVDGSAIAANGDYQAVSGTLTFAPGETSKAVTVPVNGDRLAESNESFLLVLTYPTNAFVADAKGVGNIVDDEPHVGIVYSPVYVTEGNTGATTVLFTVRLSTPYDAPVDVNYSLAEGDTEWWYYGWYEPPPAASFGSDFRADSGTLTFAPGETVKTIPVTVYGDRVGEPDEYFSVDLTGSATAPIDWGHAVGVIVDDEPRVSIGSGTVTEGNTGTKAMTLTVSLSVAYDQPVTVTYATSDGSATAGSDYQATSGSVTFNPGDTSKTITVPVIGDRLGEYDEYFSVSLTGANGAMVNNGTGYCTIFDDEPRLSVNSSSVTEGNSGTKLMTFTVTLSAAYDQTVTVRYATQDYTARVADNDYVAASGTLTFAPGQTSKTFTVAVKGDKKKEPDEYFQVLLNNNSSNALIDVGYGWGTILNDDGPGGKRK
jgi:hypothetical protein